MNKKSLLFLIILCLYSSLSANSKVSESISFYKLKPEDPDAIYFTPDNYKIKTDGKSDISEDDVGGILNIHRHLAYFGCTANTDQACIGTNFDTFPTTGYFYFPHHINDFLC